MNPTPAAHPPDSSDKSALSDTSLSPYATAAGAAARAHTVVLSTPFHALYAALAAEFAEFERVIIANATRRGIIP